MVQQRTSTNDRPRLAPREPRREDAASWVNAGWRAAWVVMLVAHLPGCAAVFAAVAAEGAGEHLGRLVALIASQVFFALKAADVAWLRVPVDRRSIVACAVAVLLLHADVVQRRLSASHELPTSPAECVVLAAPVILALRVCMPRTQRGGRTIAGSYRPSRSRLALLMIEPLIRLRDPLLRNRQSNRAPPLA